jgi:Sulfotransferase family
LICHNPKFAFIHIPKTGGTSVSTALYNQHVQSDRHYTQHYTYSRLRDKNPFIEDYLSFVFVRNPWERMVSMCSLYYGPGMTPESFSMFLKLGNPNWSRWQPFEQVKFTHDDSGNQLVSFVGRYENLDKDFASVCDWLGVDLVLPHINRSTHTDYHDYYNDETRQIVAGRFADDIEVFGYRF